MALSLKAIQDVHHEREQLHRHWKQRLERATYEAERAERQYQAVEPENRLVARSLERQWEAALRAQRDVEEEYDRFLEGRPPQLTEEQRAQILALSSDLPVLWNAAETTAADRKEIIRLVVDRVVVYVRCGRRVWRSGDLLAGRGQTRHAIIRPVSRYESLGRYEQLIDGSFELRQQGQTIKQIARSSTRKGITRRDPGRATPARRCGS